MTKQEKRAKILLIILLTSIIALLVSITSCSEDEDVICSGVQKQVEQIRKSGGNNTAWKQQKIVDLQLKYPQCL